MTGLLWLHDARLKRLALSQSPAWVWARDAKRVLWANPLAAALFDAPTPAALTTRTFDRVSTAAREVARLAATLRPDRGTRLERLRGFGAALAGRLTCSCSCIGFADGTTAVLIVALERGGIDLSLEQRVVQLMAGCIEPIAVFGDDGALLGATPLARQRLNGVATLNALGAETLMASAQTSGSAVGVCAWGSISIERLREPPAWIVTLSDPARLNSPEGTRGAAAERAAKTPDDGPSHISAPRLTAVEQRAFHELARQLARRISEAEALAAQAANANAPIKPRASNPDRPEASSGKSTDRPFLDALPFGVLVYRGRDLLYANPAFMDWTGCDSLDALAASGGLDGLTVESGGNIAEQKDRRSFKVASASTERSAADARQLQVPWDGEWASALLVVPAGNAPQASASNADVTADFSDEIRTPLNAIINCSEVLIQERFSPLSNERHRQYLTEIHASAKLLLSLIDNLLELSKIDTGKLELTFANVSLNDLIQQCVAIAQPQANRDGAIIRTSLSPQLAPVLADSQSLRRIVLNLLSASTRVASPGCQVIVSTAVTDVGDILLRVRMIGGGPGETEAAPALQPLDPVPATNDRRPSKIGLGMLLTKMLAEANHATFQINRAPNEGTRVEIVFPSARLLAAQ
jgi:signal transduction histidine kinase